jgi:hypothetical protein
MIGVTLAALALASPPRLLPTPIGAGPAYHPAAARRDGRPLGRLSCSAGGTRFGVHLELFARRRVVIVPAGIGVAPPNERSFGTIVPRGCTYPARTLAPTGVIEVRTGSRLTLGDFFRLWGLPLDRRRLAAFRTTKPLLAFVGGRRWRGDPRAIPLTRHAQIVLELGGYIPPHPSFLFPGGL